MKKLFGLIAVEILLMGLQTGRRVRSTTKELYYCWAPVYFLKPRLFVHLFWAGPDTHILVV